MGVKMEKAEGRLWLGKGAIHAQTNGNGVQARRGLLREWGDAKSGGAQR